MIKEKKEILLAFMKEKKSQHGNIYFEGESESGGRIIMQLIKSSGSKKKWRLFLTK